MAELIHTTEIPYEVGYLYFVKRNAKGNLCMFKSELHRGGRKKKR